MVMVCGRPNARGRKVVTLESLQTEARRLGLDLGKMKCISDVTQAHRVTQTSAAAAEAAAGEGLG